MNILLNQYCNCIKWIQNIVLKEEEEVGTWEHNSRHLHEWYTLIASAGLLQGGLIHPNNGTALCLMPLQQYGHTSGNKESDMKEIWEWWSDIIHSRALCVITSPHQTTKGHPRQSFSWHNDIIAIDPCTDPACSHNNHPCPFHVHFHMQYFTIVWPAGIVGKSIIEVLPFRRLRLSLLKLLKNTYISYPFR